jgi:hypothetical protein
MDEKLIKDAQYRKGLSIAFFNATNNAVNMIPYLSMPDNETQEDFLKRVSVLRDWLLEEHKNYYATVIANVGVNYRAEESIDKLQETKNLEELNTAWIMLSADERRDGEIIKVAQELKLKYKNEKA